MYLIKNLNILRESKKSCMQLLLNESHTWLELEYLSKFMWEFKIKQLALLGQFHLDLVRERS